MRLLFYTRIFRHSVGGAENYCIRLCQGLVAKGHEVHVVADDFEEITPICLYQGTDKIETYRSKIQPDLTIDWQLIAPADVHRMGSGAHASFMRLSLDAYSGLSRLFKILHYRGGKHGEIVARQSRLLANPDSLFLPNSQFCADQAIENGAMPTRTFVLHNGVDTRYFSPSDEASRKVARERLGITTEQVVFLFAAHNLRLKNYALLERIFKRLRTGHPGFVLLVAGKHDCFARSSNIRYIGPQQDMREIYHACDVFLHPTFYDSCANVVLEAMSSGKAVVMSDRCGVNELVEHGADGYVHTVLGGRHHVERQWTESIVRLGNDPGLRRSTGLAARETMCAHDFRHYVTRFEEFLNMKASDNRRALS